MEKLIDPHEAKSQVAVRDSGIVVVAKAAADDLSKVVPVTAADHPGGPAGRTCGVLMGTGTVFAIPIPAPLPHIPAHVVNPQAVGRFGSHLMGPATAISAVPGHPAHTAAPGIFLGLSAASACVLPLGFRGQTKAFSRLSGKPYGKRLRAIPSDFYTIG
jgi:hypothetical protein